MIGKVLGHADLGTTHRVYSHLDADRSRVALAHVGGALRRPTPREETAIGG